MMMWEITVFNGDSMGVDMRGKSRKSTLSDTGEEAFARGKKGG